MGGVEHMGPSRQDHFRLYFEQEDDANCFLRAQDETAASFPLQMCGGWHASAPQGMGTAVCFPTVSM